MAQVIIEEYVDKFFETASNMGYEIESCQRGEFKGERQIDFGNKKLHAGHIRRVYPVVKRKSTICYEEFEKIVPGRPCAVLIFNKINKKII